MKYGVVTLYKFMTVDFPAWHVLVSATAPNEDTAKLLYDSVTRLLNMLSFWCWFVQLLFAHMDEE